MPLHEGYEEEAAGKLPRLVSKEKTERKEKKKLANLGETETLLQFTLDIILSSNK